MILAVGSFVNEGYRQQEERDVPERPPQDRKSCYTLLCASLFSMIDILCIIEGLLEAWLGVWLDPHNTLRALCGEVMEIGNRIRRIRPCFCHERMRRPRQLNGGIQGAECDVGDGNGLGLDVKDRDNQKLESKRMLTLEDITLFPVRY